MATANFFQHGAATVLPLSQAASCRYAAARSRPSIPLPHTPSQAHRRSEQLTVGACAPYSPGVTCARKQHARHMAPDLRA